MQIIYTGKEQREFGGKVGDQKFRVPAKSDLEAGQERLVQFISFNDKGEEVKTLHTTKDVGNILLGVTSAAPRPQDAELQYAEFVVVDRLSDLPQDANPQVHPPAKNVQDDAPKRKG